MLDFGERLLPPSGPWLRLCLQFPLATPAYFCCSRRNPFHIKVYLDTDGTATGDLFWDDGESIGHTGFYSAAA